MRNSTSAIFWLTLFVFLFVLSEFFIPPLRSALNSPILFLLPIIVFFLLGAALILAVLRDENEHKSKKFMLLSGISAVGMFLSVLFHNLVYGYFIYFYGKDFWGRVGLGDEPFFFFLAILVFPAGFIVGTAGSVISLIRK
jgi:hypothetical protein